MPNPVYGYKNGTTDGGTPYDWGYKNPELRKRVRRSLSGGGSRITIDEAQVSYNHFKFPPVCTLRATLVPEYADDGRSVKYLTLAITIECTVTPFQKESSASLTDKQAGSIDEEMEVIRQRLMTPGQPLDVYMHGLGEYHINSNDGTTGNKYDDVDYGPKPQVLEWEPITSQAAKIQWLVTSRIAACTNTTSKIISFAYEAAWSLNEGGWLTRTVSAEGEVAIPFTPGADRTEQNIDLTQAKLSYDLMVSTLRTAFPRLEGFHRTENFNLTKDKKKFKINIVDTEIESNEPYPAGVVDINFKESISSDIKKGFTQWDWKLSGSVEVPSLNKRITGINPKQLAYSVLVDIIVDRLKYSTKEFVRQYKDKSDGSWNSRRVKGINRIPQKITIENEIYGTSMSVDVNYLLVCPMDLAMAASGILEWVRVPGFTWDNWKKKLEEYGIGKRALLQHIPQTDIVVDFCHPLTSPTALGVGTTDPAAKRYTREEKSLSYVLPEKENTWLDYKNKFSFMVRNNTFIGNILSESAKAVQESISSAPWQDEKLDLGPETSPGENKSPGLESFPDTDTSSESITFVMMEGSAIRLGYGINAPRLQSIGGAECIEVGTSIIIPESQPTGFAYNGLQTPQNANPNGQVDINRLRWRKTYAVRGTISPGSIPLTDGNPAVFA